MIIPFEMQTVIQPGSDAAVIRLKKDSVPELPEDAPNRSRSRGKVCGHVGGW